MRRPVELVLGAVPGGVYGPTFSVYAAWALSALALLGLVIWVVRPRWFAHLFSAVQAGTVAARDRVVAQLRWPRKTVS